MVENHYHMIELSFNQYLLNKNMLIQDDEINMEFTDMNKFQIKWWSIPLTLVVTVLLFFMLDTFSIINNLDSTIRSILQGAITVSIFYGINIFHLKKTK